MSNSGTYICNLGKDPEELELGGKACIKLRVAEKAGSKRAETRWFSAIVGGPDVETAKQLASGDTVALSGELVYTKFKSKKTGKFEYTDEMPFAKLLRVIKSPTFFAGKVPEDSGEPTADAPAGDAPPDLSDLD